MLEADPERVIARAREATKEKISPGLGGGCNFVYFYGEMYDFIHQIW